MSAYWFLIGVLEFRSSFTSHANGYGYEYDAGRELAHRLTFRKFEP